MAANDYRAYLRNHFDMDEAPARVAHTGSTYRALIFVTLAIMGVLQVTSSVAILLHLTGYLREFQYCGEYYDILFCEALAQTQRCMSEASSVLVECQCNRCKKEKKTNVDLVTAQQTPNEEMHSETLIADPLKSTKEKKDRCRKKDSRTPLAHLPIRTTNDFSTKDPSAITIIHWNEGQGTLKKIKYDDGRILVDEPGYYYVYAKTCFRYSKDHDPKKVDLSNVQLLQYIFHEKRTQSKIAPIQLTKSGGTLQWIATFNMFCAEQGRGVQLNKGDGLYVSVSNFWLLDPAADATYFGAFRISD